MKKFREKCSNWGQSLLFIGVLDYHLAIEDHKMASEASSVQPGASEDFKVFRLTTPSVSTLGKNAITLGIPLKDAMVQALPNVEGAGLLCKPNHSPTSEVPCQDGEVLISFVRHANPQNAIPRRGECFCVSKNIVGTVNESGDAHMFSIALPRPEEVNVFNNALSNLYFLKTDTGIHVARVDNSVYANTYEEGGPTKLRRISFNGKSFKSEPDPGPAYNMEPNLDAHSESVRLITQNYSEQSANSPEWQDFKTGAPRNPLAVGIGSPSEQKDQMLKEYTQRTTHALGANHSSWATFHNAWKLARLTRDNNSITLNQINQETRALLDRRFANPRITERLMKQYEPLNQYLWHTMAAAKSSDAVDNEFKKALAGGHKELWTRLSNLENEFSEIQYQTGNEFADQMHIDHVNEIAVFKPKIETPAPGKCLRDFTTADYSSNACPCRPKTIYVPCNLELPSLKKDFVAQKVTYGAGKTYFLVNNSSLPPDLQSTSFKAHRTGYSAPNNSPAGTSRAGYAAVARSNGGRNGRAVLGKGTLDSPITAAVSPGTANKFGVCQGDMLHDPDYGWLRVEGGCTSSGLGYRVDVWRGDMSTNAVIADKVLNTNRTFKHFPAGLVDADYAAKNPK